MSRATYASKSAGGPLCAKPGRTKIRISKSAPNLNLSVDIMAGHILLVASRCEVLRFTGTRRELEHRARCQHQPQLTAADFAAGTSTGTSTHASGLGAFSW